MTNPDRPSTGIPTPREAAALPAADLASWIVARIEGPASSRIRAGLLDDIEFAIGVRDRARATTPDDDRGRELAAAATDGPDPRVDELAERLAPEGYRGGRWPANGSTRMRETCRAEARDLLARLDALRAPVRPAVDTPTRVTDRVVALHRPSAHLYPWHCYNTSTGEFIECRTDEQVVGYHRIPSPARPADEDRGPDGRGRKLADAMWTLDDDGILGAIETSVSPGVASAVRTLLKARLGAKLAQSFDELELAERDEERRGDLGGADGSGHLDPLSGAPSSPRTFTCPCGAVPEPCPGPEDRPLCMRGEQHIDPLVVADPCETCGHARAAHHKLRCEHPDCAYCDGWLDHFAASETGDDPPDLIDGLGNRWWPGGIRDGRRYYMAWDRPTFDAASALHRHQLVQPVREVARGDGAQ